jgi:hypothetical protein
MGMTAEERLVLMVNLGTLCGGKWSWEEFRFVKPPVVGGF